jgi:hypothetical protein
VSTVGRVTDSRDGNCLMGLACAITEVPELEGDYIFLAMDVLAKVSRYAGLGPVAPALISRCVGPDAGRC